MGERGEADRVGESGREGREADRVGGREGRQAELGVGESETSPSIATHCARVVSAYFSVLFKLIRNI